jgi:3-oxoacyl-[acyl-carrier-protein] synthase III
MTGRPRIESLGVALPARRMTTDEVVAGCRVPLNYPLASWTGIQAHRRAGGDEFAFDLAKRAVEICFAKSRYQPSEIDLVINCNISRVDEPGRFSYEPATASRLAAYFGLDHALAFDVTNACAGMLTGLAVAADFLASGRVERALVVSGEYITHLMDTAQREIEQYDDPALPCLTLGDAGAALTIDINDSTDGVGFEAIDILTLARYCHLCVSAPTFKPEGGALMLTDSVRLGSIGTREGIRQMQLVLERLGRRPREFQHLIPHQTSMATITSATRAANQVFGADEMDEGNVVVNLAERGNTASTTHFVALWDLIHSGRIHSGDRILFTIVASGLVVGVGAYMLDDLPDRVRSEVSTRTPLSRAGAADGMACWTTPGSALPRVRFEATGIAEEPCECNTLALCKAAGEAAFKASAYGCKDFSHLIFIGLHRTDWITEPAIATFIAGELRMNESRTDTGRSTFAFDLTQGATAFLTACEVARRFVAVQSDRRILVASAELDPNAKTRPDLSLHIKTSGAAIVIDASPDPRRGLGSVVFRRFPNQVDAVVSDLHFGGPVTHQTTSGREAALPFLLEQLPPAVAELLRVEGMDLEAVNVLLVPDFVPGFRRQVAELLHIKPGCVFDPPEERMDRYTCSLPYLLHWARRSGVVGEGNVGLLVEVGSGLQVVCAIYHF